MKYLVTFQSYTGRLAETIEADSHSREVGGTSLVFRAVQRVAFASLQRSELPMTTFEVLMIDGRVQWVEAAECQRQGRHWAFLVSQLVMNRPRTVLLAVDGPHRKDCDE